MVDYAIEQGIADPDKLGVGGWSYGGISTDFIITQTTRFKAAISGAGAAEFSSLYGHDQYQKDYETELGLPLGKSSRLDESLALPQRHQSHHSYSLHGRQHRLERPHPRR